MTSQITSAPPARTVPKIAPDIPVDIDPGPVLGVGRDESSSEPEGSLDEGSSLSLTPALVSAIQSVRGYPCVSILLSTREGARMSPADAQQLERLRLNAVSRLRAEGLLDDEHATIATLDRLVQDAMREPTGRALALYAGCGQAFSARLGVEVEDRAVVDPSFATRDLVRALHRTPRHVVLVLSDRQATLFDGAGGRLAPATGSRFPMDLPGAAAAEDRLSSLQAVDKGLGAFLRLRPAPVVVAGPQPVVAAFCSLSVNLSRLAGTVYGGFDEVDHVELAKRTRPVLNRYLTSREYAALDLLSERADSDRVASGITEAWLAARAERPEMLVVEEGYRFPARLSPDGDQVWPATDVEAPDVIDDLVDELIETVLDRGGWIAIARDGSLTAHGRVVLTLRPAPSVSADDTE